MKYIIALAIVCCSGIADATDAFIGTWQMIRPAIVLTDTSLSAMRIVISEAEKGFHYHSETTSNDRIVTADYDADYEGQLALVNGNHGLMAPVKLKRIDEHTVEATYIRGMQIVATSRRVLSPDENTMTITTQTYDAEHHAVTNVTVLQRVIAN